MTTEVGLEHVEIAKDAQSNSDGANSDNAPQLGSKVPNLVTDGPSASHVRASWDRCEGLYDLDPHARLIYNRYSQSEVGQRLEKVEEPLARAKPLINQIRSVVRNANYCMLLADDECAAIAEFHDTDLARYFKNQGIAVGTFWDEACVGTNGIGTSTADTTAVTVNGEQHYHKRLHQFICSAAPLVDHSGRRYGAINLTGKATSSQTEVIRLSQFVRRAAANLHSYVFRDFFQSQTLVAIADERFNDQGNMSKILAVDDTGCIVGVTNELLKEIAADKRSELIGKPLGKVIGLEYEKLLASEERLHLLDEGKLSGRYALNLPPASEQRASSVISRGKSSTVVTRRRKSSGQLSSAARASDAPLDLDELAGTDPRMLKHVALCRRMLNSSSNSRSIPLLLQGETGTGKDAFARALHAESNRSHMPYIELNCASIPESLLDSELFGYAPGTFTGGLKEGKQGYIQAANGGTLFLDEIGDMPLASQTRLLRVLSERFVQRLGDSKPVAVDFTLICASHRDLSDRVRSGQFREDLYYRVCGAKVVLPSLREREDLELITKRLLRQLDPQNCIELSEAVWRRLLNHAWPGNIRQLQNAIQFVVFSCGGGVASLSDLPDEILESAFSDRPIAGKASPPTEDTGLPVSQTCLHETEKRTVLFSELGLSKRDQLLDALQRTSWCVAQTARAIGVSRSTVHRQMKKYGIVRPDHQGM